WIGAAVGLVIVWATLFTVRETEFVLVTQFGRPVRTVTDAGLHAKWPWQNARYFDRRLRVYNPRPSEFLTRDKKNLVIENYVCWQIADPEVFVKKVITEANAEARLHDVVWSGLSAALGNHDLESIITPDPAKTTAVQLFDRPTEETNTPALAPYALRARPVRSTRLTLPQQNKESGLARMRAERERIAKQYRAEGEEQALRIRADADRQKEEILSAAYKQAEQVRGEGDAQSTRIYGQAYSRN